MEPVIVDCDVYDPRKIQTMDVTEEEWMQMQEAIHKRARKIQKEYPDEHEEIHPIGYNWKHTRSASPDRKGKWNAEKSQNARIVADRRTVDHRKKPSKSTIKNNLV